MQAVAKTCLNVGASAKLGAPQTKRSVPFCAKQTLQGTPLRGAKALRGRAPAQVRTEPILRARASLCFTGVSTGLLQGQSW
eukprot:7629570-Pyramimonas_sp.AAC.1